MKSLKVSILIAFVISLCPGFADQEELLLPLQEETPHQTQESDIKKVFEAFGYLMGKNISSMGVQFDLEAFVRGLQGSARGENSPMTEMECIQALTVMQESAFKEQAEKNLSDANSFLEQNLHEQGIISLEEGKVQYKIEKEGIGSSLQEHNSPLIRYVGKFLDGSVFGSSSEDEPIFMEEVIAGLKIGMLGMKEGEKRTIYIHPDYAYGTKGQLSPNSLLTFEIELVQAEAPVQQEEPPSHPLDNAEIALPEQPTEVIR